MISEKPMDHTLTKLTNLFLSVLSVAYTKTFRGERLSRAFMSVSSVSHFRVFSEKGFVMDKTRRWLETLRAHEVKKKASHSSVASVSCREVALQDSEPEQYSETLGSLTDKTDINPNRPTTETGDETLARSVIRVEPDNSPCRPDEMNFDSGEDPQAMTRNKSSEDIFLEGLQRGREHSRQAKRPDPVEISGEGAFDEGCRDDPLRASRGRLRPPPPRRIRRTRAF